MCLLGKILVLKEYLSKFEAYEKQYPGIIGDSICINFGLHNGHILFSGMIHGNEVGALPAIVNAIKLLTSNKINYGGKVTFLLGNKMASLQNKRFIERDLNRSFNNSGLNGNSIEEKRALEIKKLLHTCDVLIDFHQTTMPCVEPFYIFAMHEKSYLWARALGNARIFITRKAKKPFSPDGMCCDEYMRSLYKPAVTLELGMQGFHKQAELICLRVITKALQMTDKINFHKNSLHSLAHKNNELKYLEIKHSEKFNHPKKYLLNNFINLQHIKKNEILGKNHDGKIIYSKIDGYILFPQYPLRDTNGTATDEIPPYIYTLASDIKKM